MIPFSAEGAYLLLVAEGRVLIGKGCLSGRGCVFHFLTKTCKQQKVYNLRIKSNGNNGSLSQDIISYDFFVILIDKIAFWHGN